MWIWDGEIFVGMGIRMGMGKPREQGGRRKSHGMGTRDEHGDKIMGRVGCGKIHGNVMGMGKMMGMRTIYFR